MGGSNTKVHGGSELLIQRERNPERFELSDEGRGAALGEEGFSPSEWFQGFQGQDGMRESVVKEIAGGMRARGEDDEGGNRCKGGERSKRE